VGPNSVTLGGVTEDKRTRKKNVNKPVRINFADMTPCQWAIGVRSFGDTAAVSYSKDRKVQE